MSNPAIAAQVLAANQRFYDALEALDADEMDSCWASAPAPACVHPGGPWQRGEDVAAGWAAIMSATGYIEFEIADPVVTIVDPVAWVTCVERITSAVGEGGQAAVAEVAATNLFVLDGDGWHLALHHASPVIRPGLAAGE